MLRVTDPQLANLMYLRDVTIPWMREHPERVDFDIFNSSCGTFGCMLGWYAMQRHGHGLLDARDAGGFDRISTKWEKHEFGLPEDGQVWVALFAFGVFGTLDDRARYLDDLIAQRLVALEAR